MNADGRPRMPGVDYTVLNALDPAHPQAVPCVPVLPGIGAVGYSE